MISLANNAIRDADERYEDLFVSGEVGVGDLGTLRNDTMHKKQKFSLQDGSASAEMSPSLFEGWLQIYKTPKAAIEAASRYERLNKKARTDAEEKEYGKLTRMLSLAKDFSRSHRYMMEKDKFSDQDIDYAFALEKKEKNGLSDESLSGGKTSAAVYQSLIMEQVFKGMKERASGFISQNDIEENQDEKALSAWLDQDMANCIKSKKDVMTRIAAAQSKALGNPGREELFEAMLALIKNKWISRLFPGAAPKKDDEQIIDTSSKAHADSRDALLKASFDKISEGGEMTMQLDACVLRANLKR